MHRDKHISGLQCSQHKCETTVNYVILQGKIFCHAYNFRIQFKILFQTQQFANLQIVYMQTRMSFFHNDFMKLSLLIQY